MPSKFQLRKQFRQIRAQIKPSYREEAGKLAAALFKEETSFHQSERFACYLAFKDEFDSAPIIEQIWQAKKACYLPVLDVETNSLHFVRYRYGDRLHLNKFSILEPVKTDEQIAPDQLDLVITPLVAFDLAGNRLGTGGGYYDRTFAFLQAPNSIPIEFWGLGFAAQQAAEIPSDPWDIRLQAVITEKKVIVIK